MLTVTPPLSILIQVIFIEMSFENIIILILNPKKTSRPEWEAFEPSLLFNPRHVCNNNPRGLRIPPICYAKSRTLVVVRARGLMNSAHLPAALRTDGGRRHSAPTRGRHDTPFLCDQSLVNITDRPRRRGVSRRTSVVSPGHVLAATRRLV